MIIYWIMYLVPALFSINYILNRELKISGLKFLIIAILLIIGTRENGGDYETYKEAFDLLRGEDLKNSIGKNELIYGTLIWITHYLNFGFEFIIFVTSLIFSISLYKFIEYEPNPSLMLAIAVPYLIIVVAIGYIRQGVSIALIMLALNSIKQKKSFSSLLFILLAGGFHLTSLIGLLLLRHTFQFRQKSKKIIFHVLIILGGSLAIYNILFEEITNYYRNYIDIEHYESSGAIPRLLLNCIAAFAYFWKRKKWSPIDKNLWGDFSYASIGCLVIGFFSSTAADRLGLYLIPLQMIAFGRLISYETESKKQILYLSGVLFGYGLLLGLWLNLGSFTEELWLPYKSSLIRIVS